MKIAPYIISGIMALVLLLSGCENVYTPKPRGYFRIDFPAKQYTSYKEDCPFTFALPTYSRVERDSSATSEPCWLNVDFLPFNATLHLTYKPIGVDFNLKDLQNDSRTMVYKHTIKAQEIFESAIADDNKRVYGIFYNLTGNTATSLQFYVTDSTHHYLRGVLYFNSHTIPDSIAPVQDYLTKDVFQLVKTLEWK